MKRAIVAITLIATLSSSLVAPSATAAEPGSSPSGSATSGSFDGSPSGSADGSSAPGSSDSGSSVNTGSSFIDGNVNGSAKLGNALSSNPSGVKEVGNLLSEDRSVQALSLATAADAAARPVSKAGEGSSKAAQVIADPGVLNRGSASPARNLRKALQAGSSAKEMTSQDKLFYAGLGVGIIGALLLGLVRAFAPQAFSAIR